MTVQVLYWQDVPSLVKDGDAKRQLPEWFQQEIDRRAMAQGLLESGAYLEAWNWGEADDRPGTPTKWAEQRVIHPDHAVAERDRSAGDRSGEAADRMGIHGQRFKPSRSGPSIGHLEK